MAFKALSYKSIEQQELNPEDVHDAFENAIFVFFIQMTLVGFLGFIVFSGHQGFTIKLPVDFYVLVARFVCSILMHLNVEGDMRQGLVMMKFVTNHAEDFVNPYYAFIVALMQSIGGISSEIFCIIFLCSLSDPINVLIRFIAFASIGKIDNFYAAALPSEHKLKRPSAELKIRNHRFKTEQEEDSEKKERTCASVTARVIYKGIRIIYASLIFYFLPYMAIFYPQFVNHAPTLNG